jgi:hypothetical protein
MRTSRFPFFVLFVLPLLAPLLMAAGWPFRQPPPPPQYPDVAMAVVEDLDRQLVPRLGMYTANNSRGIYWLVITTPANLSDLERASPLSRLFGQELASAFVARGYNVQEIRKASDIIFNRREGEFGLTRDVRALATRRPRPPWSWPHLHHDAGRRALQHRGPGRPQQRHRGHEQPHPAHGRHGRGPVPGGHRFLFHAHGLDHRSDPVSAGHGAAYGPALVTAFASPAIAPRRDRG